MAMIKCPECNREVSDKAPACPQCGAPIAAPVSSPVPSAPVGAPVSSPPPNEVPISKSRHASPLPLILLAVLAGVVLVGVLFWVLRSTNSDRAAPLTAGPMAIFRQPKKLVDERIQLNEGNASIHPFTLNADARIQVQVTADPKPVDVMLMTREELEKFQKALASPLAGQQYTYRQALSTKQVLRMDKTEILPSGEWSIVVMRPREAILFGAGTSANIIVTAY